MIRIHTVPMSFAVVSAFMVGCHAASFIGTDVGEQSTAITDQPSSIMQPDGTFVCAAPEPDLYAGCPATLQQAAHGMPCSLPRRTVCDYQDDGGFVSCSCMPTPVGNLWLCYGGSSGHDCPTTRPADGSACGSHDIGRACTFARPVECTCEADRNVPVRRSIMCNCTADGAWECLNTWPAMRGLQEASLVDSPCYGSQVPLTRPPLDENTPISDLTDDEVAAWCDWFVTTNRGDGPPPPSEPPIISSDGYPDGFGLRGCSYGVASACVSLVPVSYCQRLLRHGACEAPLRALDDCFLSLHNGCEIVDDGCRDMGSRPNCRQTVVQLGTLQSPSCPRLPLKW